MNCRAFHEKYDLYAAEELSASMAGAYEEHLQQCSQCRQWFELQQLIGESLRQAADASLPPKHYFEGLFQRMAPRLTRTSRWQRLRERIVEPFHAFAFSNRIIARLGRTAAICSIGIVIGLAIGPDELIQNWHAAPQSSQPVISKSAEVARNPLDQLNGLLGKASNLMQQAITPRMKSDNAAPTSSAPAIPVINQDPVFQHLDDLKYGFIRDGKFDLLPQLNKMEADLLSSGRISGKATEIPRRQAQLVFEALKAMGNRDVVTVQKCLAEAINCDSRSQWACFASYLLGTLFESTGQSDTAFTFYSDCLDRFPRAYLNEQQLAYIRRQLAEVKR